jgi:hypothetical protein
MDIIEGTKMRTALALAERGTTAESTWVGMEADPLPWWVDEKV